MDSLTLIQASVTPIGLLLTVDEKSLKEGRIDNREVQNILGNILILFKIRDMASLLNRRITDLGLLYKAGSAF